MAEEKVSEELSKQIDAAIEDIRPKQEVKQEDKRVDQKENEGRQEKEDEKGQPRPEKEQKDEVGGDVSKEGSKDVETPTERETKDKSGIDDDLLSRAVRAGISLKVAREFKSKEALGSICEELEEQQKRYNEALAYAREREDTSKKEEEKEDPLKDFDGINVDEYENPEDIKLLKTLADEVKRQRQIIEELQSGQSTALQYSQEANAREVVDWFDKEVAGLGEDFHASLGKGKYDSLQDGSEQKAKRDAIADVIATFLAGCQQMGKAPPDRSELFKRASRLVLSNEYEKIETDKLSKKLEQRSKQHIQRASSGKGDSTKGVTEDIIAELEGKYFKR